MKRLSLTVAIFAGLVCSCHKKSSAGDDENAEESAKTAKEAKDTIPAPSFLSKEDVIQAILATQTASPSDQAHALALPEDMDNGPLSKVSIEELTAGGSPLTYDLDENAASFVLDNGDVAKDIDLRKWDTAVKNQGQEGTCTAFATAAAMELLAKQKTGRIVDLSEQHLWNAYAVGNLFTATSAASKTKIVSEESWPYGTSAPKVDTGSHGLMRIAAIGGGGSNASMQTMIKAIQENKPVVWGGQSPIFNKKGIVYSQSSQYAHAMAIVGAQFDKRVPGGGYFIIKNSWGSASGDSGYVYMPFNYCSSVQCYAQPVLDVELIANDPNKVPTTPSADPATAASCIGANGTTRYDHGVKTTYNGGEYTCNNGKWDTSNP